MTVKELREVLLKYDDDLEVVLIHDVGCCVGSIEENMIVLEKKEDWYEDGWERKLGWVKGDKVLVFDEDAVDDDEYD
ncbi:hypothetical protein [Selenomonas ruminantium]|uniref:hypothetical protein n=1 Tax=Selenomonas ruminantium TaxID=971 RepID=UPI0004239A24|nr:hypothetical protein [Selenomonas ruminantium]